MICNIIHSNVSIDNAKKIGQTNFLTLNRAALRSLQDWVMQYHTYWGNDEATLENYTQYLSRDETDQKEK